MNKSLDSIKNAIEEKLTKALSPSFLNVVDESFMHKGGAFTETHFRIEVVSEEFQGKRTLERHRLVQGILLHEIERIRAFSLHVFTGAEWEFQSLNLPRSPTCHKG